MDRAADDGAGAFAFLTDEPDSLGNYDISQTGNIHLIRIPRPVITAVGQVSACEGTLDVCTSNGDCPSGTLCDWEAGIEVSFVLPEPAILAGLYLDPACGGVDTWVRGFRLYEQVVPRGAPPPGTAAIGAWTPITEITPLGQGVNHVTRCRGGLGALDEDVYVAAGLEFESGFRTVYLSNSATRIECGANLAEPEPVFPAKPRHRERRQGRSRDFD